MEEIAPPLGLEMEWGRAGPKGMRAKDLALHLTGYSTQESGPHTLSGQQTRAEPIGWGEGELSLRIGAWESLPCSLPEQLGRSGP